MELVAADSECIGNAVDVVEPRSDKRDLKYSLIVKAGRPQVFMIVRPDARGIAGNSHNVIKHHSFCRRNRRSLVVILQRPD